jgi:L-asparaginase
MKFLLLATGGTIASVPSEQGYVPALSGEALLEACPLLMGFEHDVEVVNLFSKDSSNMTPPDWLTMAQSLREHASGVDAAILLHGTDTLAWTSAALSFLLNDIAFPVVLTGSMLPPDKADSDVSDNIHAAFQFALQLALYGRRGVSTAFADLLIHGPRTIKIDTRRKKAFSSADYPLLGEMRDRDTHKVAWLTPQTPKLSDKRPWGDSPVFETNMALVPIFPGMTAAQLDAVVDAAPKAVVLEAYGLGGVPYMHENLPDSIKRGVDAGVPFILRTQSPFGGTDPAVYEVGKKALSAGAFSAHDMTRETLMTKLMLLLPRFRGEELERYLGENLCDDVAI